MTKDVIIKFRASAVEKTAFDMMAEHKDLSPSEWMRQELRQAAGLASNEKNVATKSKTPPKVSPKPKRAFVCRLKGYKA